MTWPQNKFKIDPNVAQNTHVKPNAAATWISSLFTFQLWKQKKLSHEMWWSCLSKVYEDQVHDIMMIRFNAVSHKIQEEREEQQRRQHRRRRGRRRRREDVVAHKNFGNVQRVKLVFESEMEDIKGRGTNERLSSSSVLLASHNYLYLSPLPSLLLSGKSEMRC